MHACKAVVFKDSDTFQTILRCENALDAKDYGQTVHNFDDEKWCRYAKDIVIRGCWCKFVQNGALGKELIQSGQAKLGECSTNTRWGIGMGKTNSRRYNSRYWKGENWLGNCLEVVRTCLLYTSPSPRDVEESRMPSSA